MKILESIPVFSLQMRLKSFILMVFFFFFFFNLFANPLNSTLEQICEILSVAVLAVMCAEMHYLRCSTQNENPCTGHSKEYRSN